MAGQLASASEQTSRPGTDPLARAVFALLVAACFAAFFVTQRLKHTPTIVQHFEHSHTFSPSSASREARLEKISFKLTHADLVTVTVVDLEKNVIATLVRDQPVARYKQFYLRWNGRRGVARRFGHQITPHGSHILVPENDGALAPPGEYRVELHLRAAGREVPSPWTFTLVKG